MGILENYQPKQSRFDGPEGRKHDGGKLRYDLIPARPLALLAEAYTIGAKKYGDNNWRAGIAYSRIVAAILRHLYAWLRGEERDPVDGQHHLAAVAWNCFSLIEYSHTRKEFDDRADVGIQL